jgi:hypothetical protein
MGEVETKGSLKRLWWDETEDDRGKVSLCEYKGWRAAVYKVNRGADPFMATILTPNNVTVGTGLHASRLRAKLSIREYLIRNAQ